MKLTAPQVQLVKKLIKAGKRGLSPHDMHTQTLEALLERKVVAYRGSQVVLIAPTRQIRMGAVTRTVLDVTA